MHKPLPLLICLLLVLPAAAEKQQERRDRNSDNAATQNQRKSPGQDMPPHAPASAYQDGELLGWSLHIHPDLLADEKLYDEVRAELHHQLFRITKVVPEDKVKLLRQVPIWLEKRNPYSGNCQYHPSRSWLEGNGYLPEKAKAIELSSAKGFLRSSRTTQPFVMLHELAHAYHDQHLDFGHEGILDCYNKAMEEGQYEQVLHLNGRTLKAYATTDHKEYFAEATEAFFGTNDHYPFVKAELKQHDPALFEMLKEVWLDK